MTTSNILMIRPVKFGYNYQTSLTNAFQRLEDEHDENVHEKALAEFDCLVDLLIANGIHLTVVTDTLEPHTPDSIFPNNWVSFFMDEQQTSGTIFLHPMYAVNRRLERKEHVLRAIQKGFIATNTIDLSTYERTDEFLEGTGSMVLDRKNRIAYACLSSRTHQTVFEEFCSLVNYRGISFFALDSHGRAIYHTNVMMSVSEDFVVICMESVRRESDQARLMESFSATDKDVIFIDMNQMNQFAGNCLQVQNGFTGEKLLVMSSKAFHSLRSEQIERISKHCHIIHSNVDTIEVQGGGSVRCMMAEVFLPVKPIFDHME